MHGKIKITKEIYKELISGVTGVSEFVNATKLWINVIEISIESENFTELENIGKADASAILLALNKKEILLSGDYMLITLAKTKGIDCLWLTAFIIRSVEKKILSKEEAKQMLLDMIKTGMRLNNQVYSLILNKIDEIKLDYPNKKIDTQKTKDVSKKI